MVLAIHCNRFQPPSCPTKRDSAPQKMCKSRPFLLTVLSRPVLLKVLPTAITARVFLRSSWNFQDKLLIVIAIHCIHVKRPQTSFLHRKKNLSAWKFRGCLCLTFSRPVLLKVLPTVITSRAFLRSSWNFQDKLPIVVAIHCIHAKRPQTRFLSKKKNLVHENFAAVYA